MKRRLLICFSVLICIVQLHGQERKSFEINRRLGRGINIGNTFEAPSETEWGNPWYPEYADMIAEKGFDHIRLPVRWEPRSAEKAPYAIDPEFLKRIKSVVDKAIENEMYIIVNMHHHEALIKNPLGQKERFLAQWKQIAEYFKDYPDYLLFEVLNEPNDQMTAALWNRFAADALAVIRQSNPTRTVLIGTAEWGGIGGLSQLQLPDDDNIIVTLHYYNPFEFTHQGAEWSDDMKDVKDIKWYDSQAERTAIHAEFEAVKAFSQVHNIPIHVGEFGAYNKADLESRVRWTTYLARWFEEQGFSWAYWEFSAGFGIYDPSAKVFIQPLVDALLKNDIPEPAKVVYTPVYESNFTNGTNGWNVNLTGTGKATLAGKNDKLEINITSQGSEGWYIQPIRTGIPLVKGEMYEISFTVSATGNCGFTNYVGRNSDPWNAYSGFYGVTATPNPQTFSFVFTMLHATDNNARIAFDLGTIAAPATLTFADIKLNKLRIIPTGIEELSQDSFANYSYNPQNNELLIYNERKFPKASVYDANGRMISEHLLTNGSNLIKTTSWSPGVYLVVLNTNETGGTIKIVKSK